MSILSDWLGRPERAPCSVYFSESKLYTWSRVTDFLEDTLKSVRKQLSPLFKELQKNISARIIGQFTFDNMNMANILDNQEISQALADGLMELSKDNSDKPLEFLSDFLLKKCGKGSQDLEENVIPTKCDPKAAFSLLPKERNVIEDSPQDTKSSLSKNDPNLEMLAKLQFLDHLRDRLQEWGPAHCVGEIFLKFGSQWNTYTNSFNDYPVVLRTVQKCREMIPAFRAFLKRHDKTIATKMLRFEEYINLLYALRLHTPAEHVDRGDLTTAIDQIKKYKSYIDQMKQNIRMKDQLPDIRRIVRGCPPLSEENRYLIRVQDVAQLHCCDEAPPSLFTSSDYKWPQFRDNVPAPALPWANHPLVPCGSQNWDSLLYLHPQCDPFQRKKVITYQSNHPFQSHSFRTHSDNSDVKNAFILHGPKHEWICATEAEDDKFLWLSVLQSASKVVWRSEKTLWMLILPGKDGVFCVPEDTVGSGMMICHG